MGKTSDGIKAGAASGFAYGIISAIFTVATIILFKSQIMSTLTKIVNSRPEVASHGITAQTLYNLSLISEPVVGIIAGIILGLIIGLIFAHIKDRLPGSGSAVSGIIVGLIMWVILGLLLGLSDLREYGTDFYVLLVVGSLIASLAYGYLLAALYRRFEKSNEPIAEPSFPES